jgi:chemotaxis protein MotA
VSDEVGREAWTAIIALIGFLVVAGAIAGGYLMEKGKLLVLMQPAELVIILGAALGTVLIANPPGNLKRMAKALFSVFGKDRYNTAFYLESLKMLSELFGHARKLGMSKLETDVDDPKSSAVFSKYPKFLKDHHMVAFVCDTLRTFISGGVDAYELDQMMELDMEVHHSESTEPSAALTTTADSLPGLGIVAAVLGVVITMGALGGPPEEIGHKVAAALVGTFLGILMCYGFLSPIAARLNRDCNSEAHYYHVMRVALVAFAKGSAPILAVEFARRAIPSSVRPTFLQMEQLCRGGGAASQASNVAA